ncbi:MAG: VWA domain-containing protein [Thermoplasmata archaeon]|nr:MAG: VWA domain-containing protein [Thermoplasmata archaeon]
MSSEDMRKRLFSLTLAVAIILSMFFSLIALTVPLVSAVQVTHNAGNVDFDINDKGVFLNHIYMGGIVQDGNGFGNSGDANMVYLVFDQNNYDHKPNSVDIACYPDFNFVSGPGNDTALSLLMNDAVAGDMDKSYGSFTQTDIPEDPYDVRIHQTAWTKQNENWAIIKWDVENLKVSDIINARLALFYNAAIDNTIDDDQDAWDAANDTYYLFNQGGTGTYVGFASADTGLPINLYYGSNVNDMTPLDDKETYDGLINSPLVHGPYVGENPAVLVGWEGGSDSGFTISAGASKSMPLIMAYGSSVTELQQAITDAQQFYLSTILSITEIQDEGTPRVEIYNAANTDISLANFRLSGDGGFSYWSGGSWAPNPIPAQGYSIWTLGGADSFGGTEGATIGLYDTSLPLLYDEIAFGQHGTAPDPINNATYGSISRVPGAGGYTTEWVHSLYGMSFGSDNTALPVNHQPNVILNEVMFNPALPDYGFVEMMYTGDGAANLDGYLIICDDIFQFNGTLILDTYDPYAVVQYNDLVPTTDLFDNMDPSGDNVYLYDDTGVLLDMVGWSSAHTQNMTVSREPDGFGTYDGYEDVSSVAAGWVFDRFPTIPLVAVAPPDQFGYGDAGDEVWFNLTVTNKEASPDWFEILNQSLPNGWAVEIYEEDMLTKITGPIYIVNGSTYNISVKVTIPSVPPIGDYDNTTVTVRSITNPAISFSIIVQPRVYAYLEPDKSISPNVINVLGSGYNEEATIMLNVTGRGMGTPLLLPQDVVFLIDNSGSMDDNDPTGLRFPAARSYTYNLEFNDTAAVVTFHDATDPTTGAWLARAPPDGQAEHLSNDFVRVRENINWTAGAVSGGTNIYLAMEVGMNETIFNGNSSHIQLLILLTDGFDSWRTRNEIWAKADECAANDIIVFCIGLGDTADMVLLDGIAQRTGGTSYASPDPSYLEDIYKDIASRVSEIAGYDIDPMDSSPMIRDTLPPGIDYVPGTFSTPPDVKYVNASGYTILEWNVTSISLGETWTVSFNITSTTSGYMESNNFTTSRNNYTNWEGLSIEKLFPKTMINVILGEPFPPEPSIKVVNDSGLPDGRGDHIQLYWTPPSTPNTVNYLIYRSTTPTGFNFATPWKDTSIHNDTWPEVSPLTTQWNITDEALDSPAEYYYCMRTVNTAGEISDTSRTVGMVTTTFPADISTFSFPLQPLSVKWTDFYTTDMHADYIKFMPITLRSSVRHDHGTGGSNTTLMEVGKGFEVKFSSPVKYTFVGLPGSMIMYDNVSFGFSAAPMAGNSASLNASVNPLTETVSLNWSQPAGMVAGDQFHVFRAATRDGFWGTIDVDYTHIASLGYTTLTLQDTGIATAGTEYYYMVVPIQQGTGERGVSSYSIGVWTAEYLDQYDTVGIPLKLFTYPSADSFSDDVDNAVGINHFDYTAQRWQWHSHRMPASVFDIQFEMGRGYQISTVATTKHSFVGR